jgi:hypothetical protein
MEHMHALANAILSADDTLKLLILLLAGLGLLALARWASGLGDAHTHVLPSQPMYDPVAAPDPFVHQALPPSTAPNAGGPLYFFPPDPSLGRIRVTKFFFKTIDPVPGPSDPEVFADELFLELYEPDSDHYWGQSYFVATPSGLAKILREKSWRYLHAHEVLVFPRYDLAEIRRAVVTRILADHDFFNDSEQNFEEEAL